MAAPPKTPLKKVAFLLMDGLADINIPDLGRKTPLQYANTPTFDALAKGGINGIMDPVEPGLACGSDTAHMSIFGYEPRVHYRGRGAFESMGAGLEMRPGDIAFKSNFATIDPETNIVLRRRADRNFEDIGPILCAYLDGSELPSFPGYQVSVQYATEHRCGVRVRGPGLVGSITGTDPLVDNKPLVHCEALDPADEASVMTAKLTNELSRVFHEKLVRHPINLQRQREGKPMANIVLLRGCGVCIDVPSFEEKHGMKPFMIAPTAIIAGLGKSIGMDVIKVPGTSGDYHTDLDAKGRGYVAQITDKSKQYRFGFLHVKAVDDASHDGNYRLKAEFIERCDRMMRDVLIELAKDQLEGNAEYTIVVTGDHSTPCLYGDHSHEPVPFIMCKLANVLTQFAPTSSSSAAAEAEAEAEAKAEATAPAPQSHGGGGGSNGNGNGTGTGVPPLRDDVEAFSEAEAVRGYLGRFPGSQVMPMIREFVALSH